MKESTAIHPQQIDCWGNLPETNEKPYGVLSCRAGKISIDWVSDRSAALSGWRARSNLPEFEWVQVLEPGARYVRGMKDVV